MAADIKLDAEITREVAMTHAGVPGHAIYKDGAGDCWVFARGALHKVVWQEHYERIGRVCNYILSMPEAPR